MVLGQSDLIGKPLAAACRLRKALVETCDITTDPEEMRRLCRAAKIIFSATGKLHLVDASFINDSHDQVIIDIGRGMIDGKPAGDVDSDAIADQVAAYTPVPGGVGPVTRSAWPDPPTTSPQGRQSRGFASNPRRVCIDAESRTSRQRFGSGALSASDPCAA